MVANVPNACHICAPMPDTSPHPCVLVFGGLDPTGGAGLQADQQALAAMGCHPCPIATTLTVQDTHNVQAQYPVAPDILQAQCQTLLRDVAIRGVKIGLLPNAAVGIVAETLRALPDVPVIMDPVLAATGGTELADATQLRALFPHMTLLTPNRSEAQRLTGQDTIEAQAAELRRLGCAHVLITGGDADTTQARNDLYDPAGRCETYAWTRLSGGPFHGSGCTLAAAICGLLAQGRDMQAAVAEGQRYVWETLNRAYVIGRGQRIPHRLGERLARAHG